MYRYNNDGDIFSEVITTLLKLLGNNYLVGKSHKYSVELIIIFCHLFVK